MDNWKRFQKARDSRNATELICYSCPHAETFEVGEKIDERLHSAFRLHSNFRDGKLWNNNQRPQDCEACRGCFEDWIRDKKLEGKICVKCEEWCYGKAGIQIIATYEGGSHTTASVCEGCSNKLLENLPKGK